MGKFAKSTPIVGGQKAYFSVDFPLQRSPKDRTVFNLLPFSCEIKSISYITYAKYNYQYTYLYVKIM